MLSAELLCCEDADAGLGGTGRCRPGGGGGHIVIEQEVEVVPFAISQSSSQLIIMRPAFALARQAALPSRAHCVRPLPRPVLANVGCSHWATAASRSYSAKPKAPKEAPVEIAEETLEADFLEEVEIDADPEWEGEEVSEGVFMSAMPVSCVRFDA